MVPPLAIQGTVCHTKQRGSVEVLQDTLTVVDSTGHVIYLGPAHAPNAAAALSAAGLSQGDVCVLNSQQLLLPGFIDTHCHAPQYTFAGIGTDLSLMPWLHTYTFPAERKYSDTQHAKAVYTLLVRRLLRLGTTTVNYFTSLHVGATKVLADVVHAAGQRAVIGKCCMDQHSPDSYTEGSAGISLAGAAEVVAYIQGKRSSRIMASVVPRFIPTCSHALLEGLGAMAANHNLHVHSHISESREQVAFSKQLHQDSPHDAATYDAAGLLRHRAIFAHGTQLTDDALQLMATRGASLAHCPLSNFYFGDGLLCVARALAFGVMVGLGTDVAGGYSPSMLQAMRLAVINSHALKAAALMSQQDPQQQQQGAVAQQQQQQQQQQAAVMQDTQQQGVDGQRQANGSSQREQAAAAAAAAAAGAAAAPNSDYGAQLERLVNPDGSVPHSLAAGLAGSRVAAAIDSPDVSAAALQHLLTWEDALYLATAGGAAALGLEGVVGHFAVGMEFDALLIDCGVAEVFDVLGDEGSDDPMLLLERFINNGDDRNIIRVWVQGKQCMS